MPILPLSALSFSQSPLSSLARSAFSSLPKTRWCFGAARRISDLAQSEPFAVGTLLKADSGQDYQIDEVLLDRRNPLMCVYRASAGGRRYIVKDLIPGEFEYQLSLQLSLSSVPSVRTFVDTIRLRDIFIFSFLAKDLLQLSQRNLTTATRKDILRRALLGLVELHKRDIVHNDIKPNNILVDYKETGDKCDVHTVQVSDLDDAVIVPPGKYLRGPLCGNQLWRSPESWARSLQNQASDVFSFGIVILYVMLNNMVFRVRDDQLKSENSWQYILHRHISSFADEDSLNSFLQHIGVDNPFFERFVAVAKEFSPTVPRQPLSHWEYVEPSLRDLVSKMTNLDPAMRISAADALNHFWFSQKS